MRPTYNGNSTGPEVGLLAMAALVFMCLVLVVGSLRLARHFQPTTGDIISFTPADGPVGTAQGAIAAHRVGGPQGTVCVLDPKVLNEFGGSLAIEFVQLTPALKYRVHWAGVRTSDAETDCGTSADLMLPPEDISELALAAGGRWGGHL